MFSLLQRRSGDSVTYAANSIMLGSRCALSGCYACVCMLGEAVVFLFLLVMVVSCYNVVVFVFIVATRRLFLTVNVVVFVFVVTTATVSY